MGYHQLLLATLVALLVADTAVAHPTWFMPEEKVRMEYLLEEAASAKVVDFLSGQYDDVKFTPHPTMNGFYAYGRRTQLLQIKRELATLDTVPDPPPPPLRESLPLKYRDIQEARCFTVDPSSLDPGYRIGANIKEHSPEVVTQVRELLAEFDRPLDQMMVDLKLVELTPNAIKNLGIRFHPTLVKTTVTESVNGRVVRSYTVPTTAQFRSATPASAGR